MHVLPPQKHADTHTPMHDMPVVLVCVALTPRTRHNVLSSYCSYSLPFLALLSLAVFLLPRPENTEPLKMAAIKLPARKIAFSWQSIGGKTCRLKDLMVRFLKEQN